jgi:hypothetical protein
VSDFIWPTLMSPAFPGFPPIMSHILPG